MKRISIEKDKNIIPNNNITYYLNLDYIYIPIENNNILAKQDEYIYKDQMVSKNKLYSSVSGRAIGIKKCNVLENTKSALVIQNDFREFSKAPKLRKKSFNIPNILKVLEEQKEIELLNKFKSNKQFDYIILKALDDEPYAYNKVFLLKENILELLELIEKLSNVYKSKTNYIVIKNNDAFIIDECSKVMGSYPNSKIALVNDEYLLENDEIIKEKLHLNNNALYLDILELIKLNNILNSKNESTTLITIAGDAIKSNKIIRVKKYALLSDILEKFIEFKFDKYDIIINGLMKGFKINNSNDFIISDDVFCINIMKKQKIKSSSCIKCGKCIEACPKGVNPITLKNKEKCIDCGICTYVCPCFINLREKLKEK